MPGTAVNRACAKAERSVRGDRRKRARSGSAHLEIRQIVCDSRKAAAGVVFFALHGAKEDGNTFIR